MKRNVPEEALVFTKGVFAFCIFEADEKLKKEKADWNRGRVNVFGSFFKARMN